MKALAYLLITLSVLSVCSFKSIERPVDAAKGWWLVVKMRDSTLTAIRNREFDGEHTGFYIGEDGKYISKGSKYRCGTPPLTYKNYKGRYTVVSDSMLYIRFNQYRNYVSEYDLKILSLKKDTMLCQVCNLKVLQN